MAYVVNLLRRSLPLTALLDLRKAYDLVPRDILQEMLQARLPSGLSIMLRPLLSPMRLRITFQRTLATVRTLAVTPQGCLLPSPTLVNLFIGSYLQSINTQPANLMASAFLDDMLLMGHTLSDMQHGPNRSCTWADDVRMQWAVAKSCGIQLPGRLNINGEELPHKHEEVYLGISLSREGVTNKKLLARLSAGEEMLSKLGFLVQRWRTTTQQRRMLAKAIRLQHHRLLTVYADNDRASSPTSRATRRTLCRIYIGNKDESPI